jgi:hypothetical protein
MTAKLPEMQHCVTAYPLKSRQNMTAKYLWKSTYYNFIIAISAASSHLSISHMHLTAILTANGLFDGKPFFDSNRFADNIL